MQWLFNFIASIFNFFLGRDEPEYSYGWIPEPEDARDHHYVPADEVLADLPKSVDLRSSDGPIYDQGKLGSCTANAWLGVFMFVGIKLFGKRFFGSRLMLYYDSRADEGHPNEDRGAYVRTGGKILTNIGNAPESEWPYDTSKFATKPPKSAYDSAAGNKVVEYLRVNQSLSAIKACLAEGFPIVFGFNVYESFKQARNGGVMPMPKAGEKKQGGHAVVAIGYVDASGALQYGTKGARLTYSLRKVSGFMRNLTGLRMFATAIPGDTVIVRNSWGTGWGDRGYFYMPYAFITSSDARDFWTIRKVVIK